MAKYKVGDKVRVRSDLKAYEIKYYMDDHEEYWFAYESTLEFCGKVVTIEKFEEKDNAYEIEEDDGEDYWADEMFEGLAEEKPDKPTTKYKLGDKVLVRSDLIVGDAYPDMVFVSDMAAFMGKVVTIVHIAHNRWYGIEGYPNPWWTDEMFEGLVEETPTPAAPIAVNLTINIDTYANSCWHCRKGGIVDLYLKGKPGICPSCGRVCNVVQKQTKQLFAEIKTVDWDLPSPVPKENKPLTREELEALPDGTRVFVAWLEHKKINWNDDRTCWRVKKGHRLNWEIGNGWVTCANVGVNWNAYLEEPERPEPELPF